MPVLCWRRRTERNASVGREGSAGPRPDDATPDAPGDTTPASTTTAGTTPSGTTPADTTPAADATPAVDATSSWVAMSAATASDMLPGLGEPDAKLLLVFLCFLASCDVSLNILTLGATPRKRWTQQGQVERVAASRVGLAPALEQFLSDAPRLARAVGQLERLSALSTSSSKICVLYPIRARLLAALPSGLHQFWRLQALIVMHHSPPWKYLEPVYVSSPCNLCVYSLFNQSVVSNPSIPRSM